MTRDSASFSYGQNYETFYCLLAQCVNWGFNFKTQICSRNRANLYAELRKSKYSPICSQFCG